MQLLSKREVCQRTSLSRAHIDRLTNDPDYAHYGFPKSVRLGQGRVAYVSDEVDAWIAERVAARGSS